MYISPYATDFFEPENIEDETRLINDVLLFISAMGMNFF